MKKSFIALIAFGIGAFAFYSILLDIEFFKKAVSLWYMQDNKGMLMLLVGKGNSASIFSLFLVIIEVSLFPIHTILMFQIVKELHGLLFGFLYIFVGISVCTIPLFIISKQLLIVKLNPFVLFFFFTISFFTVPVPGITLIFIYICKSYLIDK